MKVTEFLLCGFSDHCIGYLNCNFPIEQGDSEIKYPKTGGKILFSN